MQRIAFEWGETPSPDEVGAAVAESGAGVVFCTQSETSTGVVSDVQALKRAVGDATLVVDAISSLGAVPLETDAWGIDVVVSGSQKALMCPPGLAMASVAEHLWDAAAAVAELLLRLAARRGRRSRRSTPRSRRRSRSSAASTSRSGCSSTTGSRPRSSGTSASAARPAPA